MVGVNVNMTNRNIVFCHIYQYVISGLVRSKIIVQTDVADFSEQVNQFDAIIIGANTIIRAIRKRSFIIENNFHQNSGQEYPHLLTSADVQVVGGIALLSLRFKL